MEWSIQDIARSAGTTSRTLRHYGAVGLLEPSRIGGNGYRYYDEQALVRLQRILLLRELGLGLPAIAEVLDGQRDSAAALETHLELLEEEQRRIGRQIESVRTTLRKLKGGERLMAEEIFDGFDHTKYEKEVTSRWGADAYRRGDQWWSSLSAAEKQAHQQEQRDIAAAFGAAAGLAPGSDEVQAITRRLYEWLRPAVSTVSAGYFAGLGQLYVDDPRYGFEGATAEFVRDAMKIYAERNLTG
ncbi:MerR family transcriptional regulator [Amycolatopsis vancoresmycina]|uniref:MerR family transcriptional regulator n=1 Tax=Amycolatopsis vancoresmycina DSM 44592 TaxID=1292037 RepID=R1I2F4_9PSEU|nr:TipAS antibiotic-recognition domain-containing protein [Amycolatopsis vancoresmycina]EOD69965.1 MerR family transcriptional regulator [Amycolatopsis vancoresmycina DSM 44592]